MSQTQDPSHEKDRIISEAGKILGVTPRIIVCGKTGAGKSSLINALLKRKVNKVGHSEPTTQEEQEEAWTIGTESLRILDVPGFGEADKHDERLNFIMQHLPTSHIGLLIVGAPDRAWEHEREFVKLVRDTDLHFPLIVVGNRIDMFNPIRDWNPQKLNLTTPETAKEKSIVTWGEALRTACGVDSAHLVLTSAGESFEMAEERYGLDHLARVCIENLPAACQNAVARELSVEINKKAMAENVIWAASVASAGVALTPIPFADCIPLAAIQVGMIIKIADIFNCVMTKETAFNLLSPVAASFAGRTILANLLGFFPGLGSVAKAFIGAGIAGPMTFAIGTTYLEFFARSNFKPSTDEVREELKKNYSKAREKQKKMEEEARSHRAAN